VRFRASHKGEKGIKTKQAAFCSNLPEHEIAYPLSESGKSTDFGEGESRMIGSDHRNVLKIGILALAPLAIPQSMLNPVLPAIQEAFPNVAPSVIQLLSTIPSLCCVVFSPVYGKLTDYITRRKILFAAIVLLLAGGILPAFVDNFTLFLVLRFVMGAGVGLLTPAAADLIVIFFDGSTRQMMMGWNQAAASVGGVVFQLIGGYLAGINWRYACIATAVCAVFYLIAFIIIPEPGRKAKISGAAGGANVKFRMSGRAWVLSIWFLFFAMFTFSFVTTTAMMAVGEKIASSANLGFTMSLLTISVTVVALFFGLTAKIFKKYIVAVGIAVNAIAALVAFTGHSLILIDLAMVLCGVGLALVVPGVLTRVSSMVAPVAATMAMSIFYAASGLGQFVQPLVFAWIQEQLRITDFRQAFVISLAGLVLLLVYMFIDAITCKEPRPRQAEAD
jgi:MFS family permease